MYHKIDQAFPIFLKSIEKHGKGLGMRIDWDKVTADYVTTYLSMDLGAKQLVVVRTQATLSLPSSVIFSLVAVRSVLSISPSNTFSITTGS